MSYRNVLFAVLCTLSSACGSSAPDDTSSVMDATGKLAPLTAKTERQPFCGVESYKSREDAACGISSYREQRSAACGIESYNSRADMSCPGSITAASQDVTSGSGTCNTRNPSAPAGCPAGFQDAGVSDSTQSCKTRAGDEWVWETVVTKRTRHCARAQYAATCSKPEFGVAAYRSCRDASHGVERYKTCALAQFGVEQYKSCKFYMDPSKVDVFVSERTNTLPQQSVALANGRGVFMTALNDEVGMACTIKAYEKDPLYDDVVTGLKNRFVTSTGLVYDGSRYDCVNQHPSEAIESFSCADSDTGQKCRGWRIWAWAMNYVEITRQDATNLLTDLAAQQSPTIKDLIDKLKKGAEGAKSADAAAATGGR